MISNEQIENLVTDSRFQELKYGQEKTNVFTIVGQTHTEHWHSSFISWLLDAHSSMRLGHFPLARLLTLYMIKNPECGFTLRDIHNWNLDDVKFQTEKDASSGKKKRSIDVYGESEELILVIENKVNARENYNNSDTGQTQDYYDYVESHKTDKQRTLYFFITADQRQHPYSDKYVQITYQEMYDSIIAKCIEHPQISEDGKYLLEQYAANLRETIHNSNSPMALVNINLCKSIYEDYTEELDEIFSSVENTESLKASNEPACMIYEHYGSIFDEIFLSVDEKYGRTPKSKLERQVVKFTELYQRGQVIDGMRFTMNYDGIIYRAKTVVSTDGKNCYLQVLDEHGKPYRDEKTGKIIGLYESSSSAGIDVINLYRKNHGIQGMVKTLRGTTYWVNEDGKSIKDLIDSM
jgi:hypothetical protein